MKRSHSRSRATEHAPCADLFGDDGPDQRKIRKGPNRDEDAAAAHVDRKALQLCAQVLRALYHALPAHEVPGGGALRVESVQPAPDARRLLVVVSLPEDQGALAPAVRACFPRWSGMLRAEAAQCIHRKRTPEIVLQLRLRGEDEP